MTHPFSIYIWKPPYSSTDKGAWIEPIQADTQQYALYVANLIHQDSKSVIKVVDNGTTIACFPDENAVALVEKQITRQQVFLILNIWLILTLSEPACFDKSSVF